MIRILLNVQLQIDRCLIAVCHVRFYFYGFLGFSFSLVRVMPYILCFSSVPPFVDCEYFASENAFKVYVSVSSLSGLPVSMVVIFQLMIGFCNGFQMYLSLNFSCYLVLFTVLLITTFILALCFVLVVV